MKLRNTELLTTKVTLQYLKALRKVFERGLLCREHVTSMESRVVVSMIEGYRFFTEWCDDVRSHGACRLFYHCISIHDIV